MYRKIVVGYDGSEGAQLALSHALDLAKPFGAEIHALWVRGSLPHYPETISEIAEEKEGADLFYRNLENDLSALGKKYGTTIHVHSESGNPAKKIIEFAHRVQAELIVLGWRGHSAMWGESLGHVADRVSENAHCSVLLVREQPSA